MVEVVLGICRRLDQDQVDAFAELELRLSLWKLRHAQGDVLERPGLTRPFGVEERELAAARVCADEGEVVLPVDDVQAELRGDELCDWLAVRQPERDVVERLRLHPRHPS